MSISVEKPTNVRYGVLTFACALATITYLDRVCFGTVASNIQAEFGLSESQKGWLFTAFAFAYAVFEVPTGWLGDKFGARMTLIRIVLWWSIFTILTGIAGIRDDRGDATRGGPFERINNNQQLHKGVVDRLATRLHNEHVAATNVFLNLDANFSVTE